MPAEVAIITRTKDRPILLRRAAESVARQSYDNYVWVVVNDGGNESEVCSVLESCSVNPDRIRLISNQECSGMEAASNIGVRQSESSYILIHDDDDTLDPRFLEKTVGFLKSQEGARFGGVTTRLRYVSEEIVDGAIITHDSWPYLDWVTAIEISELLVQNIITTISFLYRRELWNKVGGYREDLPVLGDWYFNLQFALHADVKVLPECLAYYHHRDRGERKSVDRYANSVIEAHDQHVEFAALCRNMFIREQLQQGGLSAAIVTGYFVRDLRNPPIGPVGAQDTEPTSTTTDSRRLTEIDRLWLLSLVLDQKAQGQRILKKRIPRVDVASPLQQLAQFAAEHGIVISPPSNFDEEAYLAMYPDVAKAVSSGRLQSGYLHYALNGHLEGRRRANKT